MLCREILEGFRKTGDLFAPAPFPRPLGAGVLRKFGADFFSCFFFWLPSSGKPECAKRFFFAMCETVFCADSWCADFCADSYADFWCADFSSTFWRLKNRYSRVTQKMRRKSAEKSAASTWPCSGGVPHSISAFLSRQHVTQSPLGRRTQGEHVRVHRDIFGLKGMLAFAPRFFKNKNQRKSALRTTSL